MASQKFENEELAEKRKSVERNEKADLDQQQQQSQVVVVTNVINDHEMSDPPVDTTTTTTTTTTIINNNNNNNNNSTVSTPASNTVTITSSSTSSITPTSCSLVAPPASSSNLRDLENLAKQQQQQPNNSGGGGGKTVPSSTSSNNLTPNNPNSIISHSPTTSSSSSPTNCSSDLRRTQHESEDPNYVSVPRVCPGVNCPEKIVLCLDLSTEMEQMKFLSRAGDRFSTLQLVKRTVGLFLQSKHRLDSRHEFGLVTVHETAAWIRDFTKDPREISNLFEDLGETCECSALDIGSLLKVILRRVELPIMEDPALPPPYIVRVILIIGRSQSKLELDHEVHKMLVLSPYLFIDVFYVHEPPSEQNCCEQIFDQLCSLDVKGQSYIYEVSKNLTKLYDNMAQLLAHPLQRALQKDTSNRIRANMEEG